ncbi:TylF/MycF/NovP-related O-methyltransferase [Roseibium aggregatum]|uniref:Class I SAM-dependent methyltransferase n=1 Tax=Roseibium aggregatum TaxID=187304 RepID=A0A939EEJ4_9HYPH|nr:TylF/MycF/NovP-related O-methyltransferase [Roseibium aggregatum]MBN9671690.1 class I SAM-dependent methyltransferase [Roseibium aggregatum]
MVFGIGRAVRKRFKKPVVEGFEYTGDNLAVRKKNLAFMEDPDFARGWEKAVEGNRPAWGGRTKDVRFRAHTAVWAARHGLTLEGDFVECGVFLGLLSLTICHALNFQNIPRNFFLFDTFNGIPDDGRESVRKQNKVYFDCFEYAEKNFAPFPNAKLIKGELPGTLAAAPIEKIAYLSVDLNHALYEKEVINELWDRVSRSAVVLIDDYAFRSNEEQYEMWNEFAASKGTSVLTMPTGSGVLIKP